MQVMRDISQLQATGFELSQRKFKQRRVVRFKMDFSSGLQDSLVFFQKTVIGQPRFRLLVSRPRVTKVDVKQIRLIRSKQRFDCLLYTSRCV